MELTARNPAYLDPRSARRGVCYTRHWHWIEADLIYQTRRHSPACQDPDRRGGHIKKLHPVRMGIRHPNLIPKSLACRWG